MVSLKETMVWSLSFLTLPNPKVLMLNKSEIKTSTIYQSTISIMHTSFFDLPLRERERRLECSYDATAEAQSTEERAAESFILNYYNVMMLCRCVDLYSVFYEHII